MTILLTSGGSAVTEMSRVNYALGFHEQTRQAASATAGRSAKPADDFGRIKEGTSNAVPSGRGAANGAPSNSNPGFDPDTGPPQPSSVDPAAPLQPEGAAALFGVRLKRLKGALPEAGGAANPTATGWRLVQQRAITEPAGLVPLTDVRCRQWARRWWLRSTTSQPRNIRDWPISRGNCRMGSHCGRHQALLQLGHQDPAL